MKRNHIGRKWAFLLSAVLITACQQGEEIEELAEPVPQEKAGEVILNFTVAGELSVSADPASTRTELPGSGNIQHATSVQLYIFNGTGNDAVCIASEDVGWSAYFGNVPPTVTATMKYHVKYEGLVKDTPYTFLAVGMDASSRNTYGFPNAIQVNTTTLGNAIATLSGSETTTWSNIRTSELFAGATILTPGNYGTQGNVDLWRRVAGVMGWFTNVPTLIGTTTVTAIRITLYTQQNKSVPLLQRSQTPVFKDYIASPLSASTGGQILVQIPVPTGTLPVATLSKGAYVLPIPAPAAVNDNDYTLKVEIINAAGNTLRSARVTLSDSDDTNSSTGNGTGIIDPQGVYRFPIIANHFYGIGTPLAPINLGTIGTRTGIRAKVMTEWEDTFF